MEFLIDNYGRDRMFDLLNVFRQGSDYDEALLRIYGFDMDGLDAMWRDNVTAALSAQPVAQPAGGWGCSRR